MSANGYYASVEAMMNGGSPPEPKSASRPKPKVKNVSPKDNVSLTGAVKNAGKSRGKSKAKGSLSEKKKQKNNNLLLEESGFSSESSNMNIRRRTPNTIPRTKVKEQRTALQGLKKTLDFEENKENIDTGDQAAKNSAANNLDAVSVSSIATSEITPHEISEINVAKINERLNQVRDYLKQATSIYVSLSVAGSHGNKDPSRSEQMDKLAKLIQQLRVQESGYLDLLHKTNLEEKASTAGEFSDTSSVVLIQPTVEEASINLAEKRKELERLKEQQKLFKKIVDQQKELQQLKEKQTTLLKIQENAENKIREEREQDKLNNLPKKPRKAEEKKASSNGRNEKPAELEVANMDNIIETVTDEAIRRQMLENRIKHMQERKEEMDKLIKSFSHLKNNQNIDVNSSALNQADAVNIASEVSASQDDKPVNEMNIQEKMTKLNDARERLRELKSIVADFEFANPNNALTEASRDNRIQAQAMKKEANTLTGAGGARLRVPSVNNQDVVLNDLQALQKGIEELMDNRKRPPPKSREKKKIDVTRNPPSNKVKNKNTNQERGLNLDAKEMDAFLKDIPDEYLEEMKYALYKDSKELQLAKEQLAVEFSASEKETNSVATVTTQTEESEEESEEEESTCSSALQWQEDPEFLNKVKKLQLAKEKLHHLQNLVKVVQDGGGPNIPVQDLEELTFSISEQEDDSSAFGESEEEGTDDGEEETDEEDEAIEDEDLGEQSENGEQSEASKSTDVNLNYALENRLSDTEQRYQGLLRKQRLELNYLLKDRERLLEAQQKLSSIASQPTSVSAQTQTGSKTYAGNQRKKSLPKPKTYATLTEAELSKQEYKNSPKRNIFEEIEGMPLEPYTASDQSYNQQRKESAEKVPLRAPVSNPLAVTEIRRQRDLFEQKKKQTFVEKQRKKKLRGDKMPSDDGATYSMNSDVDEGVGVSAFSVDVTTAATWGGSTEQSSSDDSAVEDDYGENGSMAEAEYSAPFDQVEEEEEADGDDVSPIFEVKKYNDDSRRGISWYNKDGEVIKKPHGSSVRWMNDDGTPKQRKKLRQGNLTPAHKLIQDNRKRRLAEETAQSEEQPSGQLQTQLANMCTSLLRNEQTLLSMLNNQFSRGNQDASTGQGQDNVGLASNGYRNMQRFFGTQYNESFQQTLHSLRSCYERVEQHQLDMDYLRLQFNALDPSARPVASGGEDYQPSWTDTFLPKSREDNLEGRGSYQKETQTDTTLFEDPFKTSIQPYTLFGGDMSVETEKSMSKKEQEEFHFAPVLESVSPGAIGERVSGIQFEREMTGSEDKFPYRFRMSEYNPLSYQGGNFPNAPTGNTITMSRMSMKKDQAETTVTDGPDKSIWPSFFKVNEGASQGDNASDNATLGSVKGDEKKDNSATKVPNQSDFDGLRDSIYSEVATLIAMNESRPHYLIELFRELQLLNTDYLRQRALFSLHELVTRLLIEEQPKAAFKQETIPVTSAQGTYANWIASTSEQTPSESMMTTDDESESMVLRTLARQIQNNEIYDYAELADSQSEGNVSTPGSHAEAPFAKDNLGNTVINLDEALQKMRVYEQNMAKAKKTFEEISLNVLESSPLGQRRPNQKEVIEAIKNQISSTVDTISNSSAGDITSETSVDMPQPSFDTQKLDHQIKSVMRDVIPFLNEHIECTCTEELLDEIRTLIVHYAKQREPSSEKEQFGKFFHTQLDSILRGSLVKFNSRKLKECGEDMLIDVSEILFNELSFFKLMQDLNRPLNASSSEMFTTQDLDSGSQSKMPFLNQERESGSIEEPTPGPSERNNSRTNASYSSTSSSNTFIVVDAIDITDDETESQRQFVNVELSASETKPFRSSGSGEDDNEEEPSSFSKVSVPESSMQYSLQESSNDQVSSSSDTNDRSRINQLIEASLQDEDEEQEAVEDDRDEGDRDEDAQQNEREESAFDAREDERSEHEREAAAPEDENAEGQRDIDAGIEAAGDEPEGGNEQETDGIEGGEGDLPEADMASEENNVAAVVLAHMEGQQELAGDSIPVPPGGGAVG